MPEPGTEPVVAEIVPKEPAAVQIVKVIVSAAVVLTVVVTAVLLWQMKRKKHEKCPPAQPTGFSSREKCALIIRAASSGLISVFSRRR